MAKSVESPQPFMGAPQVERIAEPKGAISGAHFASVRRAGGGDDRQHELKPLAAIQRVRLPPGKGRAGQPEASLACEQQCETRSVGQQVPKLRQPAPKSANARSLRCA